MKNILEKRTDFQISFWTYALTLTFLIVLLLTGGKN